MARQVCIPDAVKLIFAHGRDKSILQNELHNYFGSNVSGGVPWDGVVNYSAACSYCIGFRMECGGVVSDPVLR